MKNNTINFKKVIGAIAAGSVLMTSAAINVFADEPMLVTVAPAAAYTVEINGETLNLGGASVYKTNDKFMIPVRAVAEKLGFTVTWDEEKQGVKLDNGEVNTVLYIGEDIYYMASSVAVGMGAPTPLGAAPELKDSTTYVPAELFNVLYYNPDTVKEDGGKIIINTNADGGDSVQIPNPFTEHKTIDDANKVLSFDAKVPSNIPSGYKVDYISTMSNDFLQIGYKNGDNEILYRMAKGSDDIGGDYNDYKNIESKKVGDYSFIIRGNENDKAANLLWTDGKYTYSLYANPEVGTDVLMSIADTVVNAK